MSYPHAMRLAGPWDYEVLRTDAGRSAFLSTGRVQLPADWQATLGDDYRGVVRYRRHFNRPTNLDPHERVWLAIDGVDARGDVMVNGASLGEVQGYALPAEFEVTALLTPHNELVIDVECPADDGALKPARPGREQSPGGIIRDVRLEIRREAFISGLSVEISAMDESDAEIVIRGLVDGQPLPDLGVRVAFRSRELGYQQMPVIAESTEIADVDRDTQESSSPLQWPAIDAGRGLPTRGGAVARTEVADRTFEICSHVQNVPRWPGKNADGIALEDIEVALLSSGTRVWQAVRSIAVPPSFIYQDRATWFNGARIEYPLEFLPKTIVNPVNTTSPPRGGQPDSPGLFASHEILSEAAYSQLDRIGVAVVQHVTPQWFGQLRRRLSHHPSIAAWTIRVPSSGESDPAHALS